MPTHTQVNRPVRISTPLGQDVLLVKSLTGGERLGQPFQYDLVLASEGHELDYKKIIGQNVTVFVDKEGKEPRFFNGFISRFAQTKYEQKLAEYHATIVPWLWFLTRSSDCRIFQNQTIPEILKQVFDDHGFSDIIDRLHGSYRKWDYCVQYRETAYDFVSRLMEEEGIYYYFKHEKEKHTLVLCDSPASHKQFGGYEELLYRPSSASVQETLWTWVVQHEVQPGGYATTDFDFTTPRKGSLATNSLDRGHSHGEFEQFDYLGEQSPFNEGERYSKLRLEELQAQHETYSGEGDARGACTGVRFVLKGHPRKEFEKEYLTTGAEYVIRATPLGTGSEQGEDFEYNAKMTATLLEQPFRAPRITPKPRVQGPQTAIVVGPKGEKIHTDQYGRVKVQFHWDRRGNKDENSSCWVRVSQSWAGKPKGQNWGDMAIPHVGDEVIVDCLEGDPDRPIITGRVYNQANMPPMVLPANENKRVWSDDYGNELVFDATPGDEHIVLRSPHHNSGITLGRSSTNFTETNTNTVNCGDSFTMTLGATAALTAGGALQGVIGASVNAVLGLNASCNVGPQIGITIGPQFTITRGIKYDNSADDDYKICDKNYVISAGGVLNLIGGAGPINGSSIIYANDDKLELTVGDAVTVKSAEHAISVKGFNIASGVLFVTVAALMAGTGGYVDAYNPNPNEDAKLTDDQAKQDAHTKRQNDSLDSQKGYEIAAGVTMAAALGCMLVSYIICRKELMETQLSSHVGDASASRILLTRTGEATLEADKVVSIYGNERKSVLRLGTKCVTLENKASHIIIRSGTTEIRVLKKGVTISGDVTIKGKLDVADGALTVQGVAVPSVSDLDAEVAKLKATDAKEAAQRRALNLKVKALEASSLVT